MSNKRGYASLLHWETYKLDGDDGVDVTQI